MMFLVALKLPNILKEFTTPEFNFLRESVTYTLITIFLYATLSRRMDSRMVRSQWLDRRIYGTLQSLLGVSSQLRNARAYSPESYEANKKRKGFD
jgi:hypothetical protein